MRAASIAESDSASPLFVVIVNWNLRDDTIECISSLFAAGVEPGSVILVDNGSTDGSQGAVRDRFGRNVILIESERNLGFAGGVNLGIVHALDLGANWVLLINNDTVVDKDFISALTVNLKSEDGKQAVYGPAIFYYDQKDKIWFFGDRLLGTTLFTYSLHKNAELPKGLPLEVTVDFVNGCGMLIPRVLFQQIGLFDTSLFMYGEEVDFCWRARLAGFRMVSVAGAHMWHKVSASSHHDKPRMRFLRIRNQIWFYRRYSTRFQFLIMACGSALRMMWMTVRDAMRRDWDLIRPLWTGWWRGWTQTIPKHSRSRSFHD